MSTRQIRKRVEKVESLAEHRNGISAVSLALAHALSFEELRALETKLIAKPGGVLADVLTADEMAELVTKLAAAQQRPSCHGTVA
jgi:hypothetical protein